LLTWGVDLRSTLVAIDKVTFSTNPVAEPSTGTLSVAAGGVCIVLIAVQRVVRRRSAGGTVWFLDRDRQRAIQGLHD
jgi:hypothetical protein